MRSEDFWKKMEMGVNKDVMGSNKDDGSYFHGKEMPLFQFFWVSFNKDVVYTLEKINCD